MSDGPGIGLDGLWLETFGLQMFPVFSVITLKGGVIRHVGIHCNHSLNGIDIKAKKLAVPWPFLLQEIEEDYSRIMDIDCDRALLCLLRSGFD